MDEPNVYLGQMLQTPGYGGVVPTTSAVQNQSAFTPFSLQAAVQNAMEVTSSMQLPTAGHGNVSIGMLMAIVIGLGLFAFWVRGYRQ